jgi:hypothetical protein
MKLFEVIYWSGYTVIMFAETRRDIRRKLPGHDIREINRVEIH